MDDSIPAASKADSLCRFIRSGGGLVFARGDEGHARACAIWNGAVDHSPALVVPCRSAAEVAQALAGARSLGLPISVRGGGHDWAGRALARDGMVIDLSPMREITVDPGARTATVSGTITTAELSTAVAPHGLAAVSGNCGAVGVTGHLLGGGYGPFTPHFGLAADNLVSAEVVLADGRTVTADAARHQDLFWALRGGGGNFGVVTAMRVRLHPVPRVLAGLLLFPWAQAEAVLRGCEALLADAPDVLAVSTGMLGGPDGRPMAMVAPVWSGDIDEGHQAMQQLRGLGTPVVEQIAPMRSDALTRLYDAQIVNGRHYALETRWLPELSTGAAAAVIAAGDAVTSPFSAVVMHHFQGAATRVAADATAFGQRRRHILVEIVAGWQPGDGTRHRAWARGLSAALAPHALPGGYANLLAPDATDQIGSAYGSNAARLREVKRRYDPDGLFSAIPLPD
jgi:FAD/FMN-containing dehydrogenase